MEIYRPAKKEPILRKENIAIVKREEVVRLASELIQGGVENLRETINKDIPKLKTSDEAGWSVAHQLAQEGNDQIRMELTKHLELLKLNDKEYHWSVAHEVALKGPDNVRAELIKQREVLHLRGVNGMIVIDVLYKTIMDPKVLRLI
jgi:hypothetical protein